MQRCKAPHTLHAPQAESSRVDPRNESVRLVYGGIQAAPQAAPAGFWRGSARILLICLFQIFDWFLMRLAMRLLQCVGSSTSPADPTVIFCMQLVVFFGVYLLYTPINIMYINIILFGFTS
jgi:hypothetical protein